MGSIFDDPIFSKYDGDQTETTSGPLVVTVRPKAKKPSTVDDISSYDIIKKYDQMLEASAPKPEAVPVVELPTGDVPINGDLSVNNVGRAFARGVPVIGGLLNKANAATNAFIAPVGNMFFSDAEKLKGETFDERYANSLAQQNATDAAFKEQNPKTNLGAEVAGAIGATIPAAATALGARALGVTGETLATRALASAGTGAGLNGVDAITRYNGSDNGPIDVAKAAGIGGVLGAAVPYAGAAVGPIARAIGNPIVDAVSPVASRVANKLGAAFEASGSTAQDAQRALASNPRLMPVDVNPALTDAAQGIIGQKGSVGSNTLTNALSERAKGAKDAVRGVFSETAGEAPNVPILLNEMKTTTQANARKGFGEALKDAKPIDLEGFSNNEVKKISDAWNRALQAFPDPSQARFTQAEMLHMTQQQLRREADTLSKSATGTDKLAAGDISAIRNKLVDKIDVATGGKFKPAQKQYADDIAVQEAFDNGTKSFDKTRADVFDDAFQKLSSAEKDAMRLGARTAMDNVLQNAKNPALAGRTFADADINFDKLRTLFGVKEADRLSKLLKDETRIAATNNKLLYNSETSSRGQNIANQAPREVGSITQNALTLPTIMSLGGGGGFYAGGGLGAVAGAAIPLIAGAVRTGARAVGRANDIKANNALARILAARGEGAIGGLSLPAAYAGIRNQIINSNVNSLLRAPAGPAMNEYQGNPLMVTVRKPVQAQR